MRQARALQPLPRLQSGTAIDINGLDPDGMAPWAVSRLQTLDVLKAHMQRATVLLVGDCEETCNLDRRAVVADPQLTGVEISAQVMGFNVLDTAIRALPTPRSPRGRRGVRPRHSSMATGRVRAVEQRHRRQPLLPAVDRRGRQPHRPHPANRATAKSATGSTNAGGSSRATSCGCCPRGSSKQQPGFPGPQKSWPRLLGGEPGPGGGSQPGEGLASVVTLRGSEW